MTVPRRIAATLPDPTPVQVAFLLGQASGLDPGSARGERAPSERVDRSEPGPQVGRKT
jgi:hypothetical protein